MKKTISPQANALLEQMMQQPPRLAKIKRPISQHATTPEQIRDLLDSQILAKNLGDLLRQAREKRNLSTRDMAARVGVSQPRVVAVEKAQTQLEIQTLVRFAAAAQYRVAVQLIPVGEPGTPIEIELSGLEL
jgi:ribosome-binding protein aMBF1 (putative translation factor)